MTFEEWWSTYLYLGDDLDKEIAQVAWEAGAESVANFKLTPDGYVLVTVDDLKQIEDAIAFELGGEPCGLFDAYKLVKTMIQATQEMSDAD